VKNCQEEIMIVSRLTVIALVLLAAGCAGPHRAGESAAQKPVSAQEGAGKPPVAPAAPSEPAPVITAVPASQAEVEAPKPEAPVAKPEVPKPAAKVPTEPAPKKEAAVPPAPKPAALDVAALEKRLKDTGAIGVFTKLTLKNQVDELLGKFRAYYKGELKTNLAQLRQPYDLLIIKVLSLLQDGDPALARAVADSREAIWGILSDPEKFRNL
jgi:hypothetical protein